ncbi:MAG: hypothetical protein R2774_07620 [Saprospiraceae bacterium]
MKYHVFAIIAILFYTSCNKETANEPAPADASVAKYLFDAVKEEVDLQLNQQSNLNGFVDDIDGSRGGCASVTVAPQGITFPKVVTIVFPENCSTYAGALAEGTVTITINGRVREAGTITTFSLRDFKYKSYIISGDYQVTFNGALSHTTVITNGKVVTPEGKTITYAATNVAIQTDGSSTTFKTNPTSFFQDDVYSVTTSASGSNTNDNAFKINTSSPLTYKVACQWITSGIIEIVEESQPKITATLDYGDDACDNKADLTFNGISKSITLP